MDGYDDVVVYGDQEESSIEAALTWIKDHPGLSILWVGAAVTTSAVSYYIYRTFFCGMFSRGVATLQGQPDYQITATDVLQIARAMLGEVSESSSRWLNPMTQRDGAAVAHALLNGFMRVPGKRSRFGSLSEYTRYYCQPLSPLWNDPTDAKCVQNPTRCTPSMISRRNRIANLPWSSVNAIVANMAEQFAKGCLANPVGGRTDWAARGFIGSRPDQINVGGNLFHTHETALPGLVKIR